MILLRAAVPAARGRGDLFVPVYFMFRQRSMSPAAPVPGTLTRAVRICVRIMARPARGWDRRGSVDRTSKVATEECKRLFTSVSPLSPDSTQ